MNETKEFPATIYGKWVPSCNVIIGDLWGSKPQDYLSISDNPGTFAQQMAGTVKVGIYKFVGTADVDTIVSVRRHTQEVVNDA